MTLQVKINNKWIILDEDQSVKIEEDYCAVKDVSDIQKLVRIMLLCVQSFFCMKHAKTYYHSTNTDCSAERLVTPL